jgi:8-oxo-dGTP pyrophosphatase MutT (NUDIX family)
MTVSFIHRVDLTFDPRPWGFAESRRGEIASHFARAAREKPLWNGHVLLMHDFLIGNGSFTGSYFETDFASLLAWRDWGWPDRTVRNCFAQAVLRGSDGGFVMGVMGAHTANAGQVYFPSGTPDRNDIADGKVDLTRSVARELGEETGLSIDAFDLDPGWYAVHLPPRIAMMKIMQAHEPADIVKRRIGNFLAGQEQPELSDVVVVRQPEDLDPCTQDYAVNFLHHIWSGQSLNE